MCFGLLLTAAFTVTAVPLLLLAFYGIHGGMPWNYSLVAISERNPGLDGFLYRGPAAAEKNE
jgi:hypothetical protein